MHSVLWEITICVMLYATVLLTEFALVVLESDFMKRLWPGGPRIGHFLHKFAPFAAVLGLGLSLLHQSSLGATYGVLVARPIWFKPSLPVMFVLSAVGSGTTTVPGITVLYENLTRKRQIPTRTRNVLAMFGGMMLPGYLYLNMWNYLATNYYSQLLVIVGIIVNRLNVTLSGLIVPLDWSPGVADVVPVNAYRPSWVEWGVASLVIGHHILMAFTLGLRYLPFFPHEETH